MKTEAESELLKKVPKVSTYFTKVVASSPNIRFKALEEISPTFKCLSQKVLLESTDQDIIVNAKALAVAYPEDISLNLGAQMQRLKCGFSNPF